MARIHDLLRSVATTNEGLADEIRREIDATYGRRRAFGLNFERHTPEAVELPGRAVRKGDKVHILPPRGETVKAKNKVMWFVESIDRKKSPATAEIFRQVDETETEMQSVDLDDLVVVAEFRDPIYPGLVSTGKVERGGDKPYHSVINAENFHALQALMFTHRGKVDVVTIDPPYNTGNQSWTYNDSFVDANDTYRHSKWLAFMERRLLLAKELMSPCGLVFINIDDSEMARLKLLCDQVFDSSNFVANLVWKSKSGGANDTGLAVDHEYILIYRAGPGSAILPDSFGFATTSYNNQDEGGKYSLERLDKQNLGYQETLDFSIVGPDGVEYRVQHKDVTNKQARWRWARATVEERFAELVFKDGNVYTKNYEKDEYTARSLLIDERFGRSRSGSSDLKRVFGKAKMFDYPKPVKLLEHLLHISAGPNATILDFFGGSGTTAVAVIALNAADGGARKAIVVTNNELTQKVQTKLVRDGHRPLDAKWSNEGVFEKVCEPRIRSEITGFRPDGEKFSEGFEDNVEFFTLTYESQLAVSQGLAFERIAPLLWIRAGQVGRRIESIENGFDVADVYGVIADLDRTQEFVSAVASNENIRVVFVVTEEDRLFETFAQALSANVEVVRLYDDYFHNFEIDAMAVDR